MKILNLVDQTNQLIGRMVSYAIWIGAAVLAWEVVSRYAFGQPTVWAHGYTQRIFASYFILIGAYTLLRDGHVRVDILLHGRSPRVRALFDLLNYGFLFIWCAALTYEGWHFFQEALLWNEKDDSALGHPLWPIKMCLFIAAALITVQAIAGMIRCLATMITSASDALEGVPNES